MKCRVIFTASLPGGVWVEKVDFGEDRWQMAEVKCVTIYSDGACEGNPGVGGWAAVLQYGEKRAEVSGGELATTNNRMELRGALEGLRKLKEACEVEFYTDSEYLRNGIMIWCKAWKRKNWKKGLRPVRNADLWQALDAEAGKHKVTWHWVKGHSGNAGNERCDMLAVTEIGKLKKAHSKAEIAAALKVFVEERNRKPWLEEKESGDKEAMLL